MPKILDSPKDKIIEEAKTLLRNNGYKNLSMRQLAKNSGIALGTLYNYFENKYAIVSEIFNLDWKEILNELNNVNDKDLSFEEKIREIKNGLEIFLKHHMGLFLEILKEDNQQRGYHKEEVMEPIYIIVDDIINLHREKGEITIPIETRKLSLFIVTNLIIIIREDKFSFDDLMILINK